MDEGKEQRDQEMDELGRTDDAVIGRAFRWSTVAILAITGVVALAIWQASRKPPKGPEKVTQITPPVVRETPATRPPVAHFTDVTEAAGIRFVQQNGAVGEKLLPETMGGGCAFFDCDGDGDVDLLLVNGTWWPGKAPAGKPQTTAALYLNDGRGHFTEATVGSGLDVPIYGMGVAVGDYDNDGRPDVYLTAVGGGHLFRNLGGGRFEEITIKAGVGGDPKDWSTSAAWFDLDNDGDLDLFVANYVRWSRDIDFEVNYKLVGVGRAYGPPTNFEGAYPHLYRNNGDGTFTEISEAAGVQVKNPATGVPGMKSLGIAPVDINEDGWMDLVVANDTTPNVLFLNTGKSTFKEAGAVSGVAFDPYGNTRGAMGIDAARFRNDRALGIGIGNFANEMTALYVSTPNDVTLFTDEAIPEGIGPASRLALKFGLFFFDYDLDGWLDVLTSNGHLEEEINKVQQSQHYRQPAQLFWNTGGVQLAGGFVNVGAELAGSDLFKPLVGRGSAYADIDGDGDLDVVITQVGGAPLLLRNDQQLDHGWVRLKLVGVKSNRDAIGAWVTAVIGGRTLQRQVMPTKSYLSQSELTITLGLGTNAAPVAVEVLWPGGSTQSVTGLKKDEVRMVRQM